MPSSGAGGAHSSATRSSPGLFKHLSMLKAQSLVSYIVGSSSFKESSFPPSNQTRVFAAQGTSQWVPELYDHVPIRLTDLNPLRGGQ